MIPFSGFLAISPSSSLAEDCNYLQLDRADGIKKKRDWILLRENRRHPQRRYGGVPMCPSQSKKLCFFLWCMVGRFLKKVLSFPVTTFVLYPQWYGRWVTRMAQQYTVHEKGMGEEEGIGEWFVRFPFPPPTPPPFFDREPLLPFGRENWRRRRSRVEGGGGGGGPQLEERGEGERGRPKIFADASENGSSPPPLLPNPKWAGGQTPSLALSRVYRVWLEVCSPVWMLNSCFPSAPFIVHRETLAFFPEMPSYFQCGGMNG